MNTRVLVVTAAVVGSVACGSSTNPVGPALPLLPEDGVVATGTAEAEVHSMMMPAFTPAGLAGVWTVYTVDGAPLPAVLMREGDIRIELLSDTLTLRADGTATERAETRFIAGPRDQTSTTIDDGSFRIEGDTIHLGLRDRRRIATLRRGLLVVPVDGKTWVFRRS